MTKRHSLFREIAIKSHSTYESSLLICASNEHNCDECETNKSSLSKCRAMAPCWFSPGETTFSLLSGQMFTGQLKRGLVKHGDHWKPDSDLRAITSAVWLLEGIQEVAQEAKNVTCKFWLPWRGHRASATPIIWSVTSCQNEAMNGSRPLTSLLPEWVAWSVSKSCRKCLSTNRKGG